MYFLTLTFQKIVLYLQINPPINLLYPILFTTILLFFFLFSLYVYYIYFYNNSSMFFGKINKYLYIFSTIICVILFIPFIYYINTNNLGNYNNMSIFIDILIMITSFILWMISIYYKNVLFRNVFIIIIIIVNIHLLYIVNNKDILSMIGLSYLLFHHIFIDFILWNYYIQ